MDELLPREQRWIRDVGQIGSNPDKFYVVCCTYAQAIAFHRMRAVQMDLSFKMVAGKVNTFTIVGWNENTKSKILPYTRFIPS